jgi:hypothetical protein
VWKKVWYNIDKSLIIALSYCNQSYFDLFIVCFPPNNIFTSNAKQKKKAR